jgi:hypothetical protein
MELALYRLKGSPVKAVRFIKIENKQKYGFV